MDKPWKVISAFVGVFIFGAIFGGLLALRIDPRPAAGKRPPQFPQQPLGPGGGAGPMTGILRHFAEQLELTPEQREKIRPMVERADEDIRRIRQTGLRETGIILKRLQEDFAGELTPEQRKKLEKIQAKMQERLRDAHGPFQPLREKFGGKRPVPGKDFPPKDAPPKDAPAKDAPATEERAPAPVATKPDGGAAPGK